MLLERQDLATTFGKFQHSNINIFNFQRLASDPVHLHIYVNAEMHRIQYSWALQMLYVPAIWLAKASLLFQLIRIFTPMKSGPVYWACHTLIWSNLLFYISILLILIFECHPIDKLWKPSNNGYCINRNTVLIASGGVNVFSDLLNLLLPLWAIWHLQMAPKRKLGISAIFATGSL